MTANETNQQPKTLSAYIHELTAGEPEPRSEKEEWAETMKRIESASRPVETYPSSHPQSSVSGSPSGFAGEARRV